MIAVLGLTVILYCVTASRRRLEVSAFFRHVRRSVARFRNCERILHGRQFHAEANWRADDVPRRRLASGAR